jgi:predicted  nucleic acid-binding Zn-ribbon protein
MSDDAEAEGLRGRITRQGEDTLGRMAEDLLANPLVSGAIQRAFDAREKASAAQEAAFGALNIPTAGDIERLTRRVRSVSQRLEGIEDGIDRLDERLAALPPADGVNARLERIEEQLTALTVQLAQLREDLPAKAKPAPARRPRAKAAG